MPVKELFRGVRHVVSAWLDSSGDCATEQFIVELYGSNNPDAEALVNEMDKTSDHGPSHNEHKFRYLDGTGRGLVEFKARGGSRVLAFIDPQRRRIICTHGIPKLKPKQLARQIEKAHKIREAYLIENMEEGSKYVN